MSKTTTSVIVHGATGRMGARLCALAQEDPSFVLAAAVEHAGSSRLGEPAAPELAGKTGAARVVVTVETGAPADVVIDFSSDDGAAAALRMALERGAALLVGTTALSGATLGALRAASGRIGVLVAPNTSLGVAAVADAAARLSRALGPGFDCSIVEAHHIHKKDAPSGTALRLAQAVRSPGDAGEPSARLAEDQILAVRGGDVIGEHTIRFAGPGEVVELTHRATSRDLFARGALRAAAWLKGRGAGWWTMEDVLGVGRG